MRAYVVFKCRACGREREISVNVNETPTEAVKKFTDKNNWVYNTKFLYCNKCKNRIKNGSVSQLLKDVKENGYFDNIFHISEKEYKLFLDKDVIFVFQGYIKQIEGITIMFYRKSDMCLCRYVNDIESAIQISRDLYKNSISMEE